MSIKDLKNRKSAGADGITAEIFKQIQIWVDIIQCNLGKRQHLFFFVRRVLLLFALTTEQLL